MNVLGAQGWTELLLPLSYLLVALGISAAPGDENWDTNFGIHGVEGRVYAIIASGNHLYVGGDFLCINGVSATNIAKWDGTTWSGFDAGLGRQDQGVRALLVAGGRLFAGGVFTNSGSRPVWQIAEWTGNQWASLANGPFGGVFTLAWDGTNLFAGGKFPSIDGVSATNIARWDGTTWWPLGLGLQKWRIGAGSWVNLAKVYSLTTRGTELYVSGEFEVAGTANSTNLAAWNNSQWASLGRTLPIGSPLAADEVCLYANLGASIGCWNGATWSTLGSTNNFLLGAGALVRSGRHLYAGGTFSSIGGVLANRIARWDGNEWSPLGSGIDTNGGVLALASSGSDIFVGGLFNSAGGKPATNIARWRIPHELKIRRAGNDALISWPATGSNLTLEASTNLAPTGWSNISEAVAFHQEECVVTNAISGSRFFRLLGR